MERPKLLLEEGHDQGDDGIATGCNWFKATEKNHGGCHATRENVW